MFDAGHDLAFGRAVGSQLVGDHDGWCMYLFFKRFSYRMFDGLGSAAALHKCVGNEAIPINGPPQPVFLAANGDNDLIEAP